MKRPRPRAARALAIALVLATAALHAAGCGGAMSGGGQEAPRSAADTAMEPAPPPPPRSVDEALAQLQTAELDINAQLGGAPGADAAQQYAQPPGQAGGAQTQAAPPPAVQPASPANKHAEAKKAETADTESLSAPPPDPCTTACRALASMDRAAEHLCGLAGSEDPRCGNARQRVQIAAGRVHQSCPHCAHVH
jgi:hypothetical protein